MFDASKKYKLLLQNSVYCFRDLSMFDASKKSKLLLQNSVYFILFKYNVIYSTNVSKKTKVYYEKSEIK